MLLLLYVLPSQAQYRDYSINLIGDSARFQQVDQLNQDAFTLLSTRQYNRAIQLANQAILIADTIPYRAGEARGYHTLGKAYEGLRNFNSSLESFLQATRRYERINDQKNLGEVYLDIALSYQRQQGFEKAISYFNRYVELSDNNIKGKRLASIHENMGFAHAKLGHLQDAEENYQLALDYYEGQNNKLKITQILTRLSSIAEKEGKYDQAIKYSEELAQLAQVNNQPTDLVIHYNNLGYFHKRKGGDDKKPVDYFNRSQEILDANRSKLQPDQVSRILINIGVAYSSLNAYSKAKEYYEDAIKVLNKNPEFDEDEARAMNFLASNYYVSGNNSQAYNTVNEAIKIAEAKNYRAVLANSYLILSMILEKDRNVKQAEYFRSRAERIQKALDEEYAEQEAELMAQQLTFDQEEESLRNLIAENERINEENKRIKEEEERRQNELSLLRERARNDQLELDRARQQQALNLQLIRNQELEKNRILAEAKIARQRGDSLEREKRFADVQAQNKIAALEKEKQLADEKAKREKSEADAERQRSRNNFFAGIIALVGFILVLVVFFLINARRSNKKIKQQNEEITERNTMIQEQNHQIEKKNEELEDKNQKINDSIRAAETIQTAILPQDQKLQALLDEYFVLYLPLDIVSGDFYWASKVEEKLFVAAVDCTGHGVPGAFMAMIGNTILNELVNASKLKDPAEILVNLHDRIVIELKQKETKNQDGMDMGLCALETISDGKEVHIAYAGAKRPLYYIKDGKLEELKGDKKSIGGTIRSDKREFVTKDAVVPRGTYVYLSTDGFEDLPNPKRKKYGKARLKLTLEELSNLPLAQQGEKLMGILQDHRQDANQRDDVTLIGFRV